MLFDVTLKYSEGIVRAAALASWRRAFGVRFVIALVLVGASLMLLAWRGDRSWFVGMLGTVLVLGVVFAVVAYLVSLRSSLRKLHQMRTPEATFQGQSSGFHITSELGTIGLPWGAVKRVWRYPHFWLLVLSRSSQLTIPLAAVGSDTQSIILERIKSAGGEVGG
jgi:hypothetical protein